MSLDAVNAFYAKVASDSAMQKAFVHATQARIVSFAADYNFKFTEAELKAVADEFKARTDKLRDEVNALREEDLEAVVGGVATEATATAQNTMKNMPSESIFNRLGDVLNAVTGAKSG